VFAGKWKQVRGQAKEWCGKFTDDDLERVEGRFERLVGVLQERSGGPGNRPSKKSPAASTPTASRTRGVADPKTSVGAS
jgi:uncharacterized protein YjbJ (UPF0337 family)